MPTQQNNNKDDDLLELSTTKSANPQHKRRLQSELSARYQNASSTYQQLLANSHDKAHQLPSDKGFFKPWQGNNALLANQQSTLEKLAALQQTCTLSTDAPHVPRPRSYKQHVNAFSHGVKDEVQHIKQHPIDALVLEPCKSIASLLIERAAKRIISANGLILPMGEAERQPSPPKASTTTSTDIAYMSGRMFTQGLAFGGVLKAVGKAGNLAKAARRAHTVEPPKVVGFVQPQLELRSVLAQEKQYLQQVIHSLKPLEYRDISRSFKLPEQPCKALSNYLYQRKIRGHLQQRLDQARITVIPISSSTKIVAKTTESRSELLVEIKSIDILSSLKLQHSQLPRMLGVEFRENASTLYLSQLPGRPVGQYLDDFFALKDEAKKPHLLTTTREAVRALGMALGELHAHDITSLSTSAIATFSEQMRMHHEVVQKTWGSLFPLTQREVESIIREFQNNPGNCSLAHGDAHLYNFMYDPQHGLSMCDVGLGVALTANNRPLYPSLYEFSLIMRELHEAASPHAELIHLRQILEQTYFAKGHITPESYRFFCLLDCCSTLSEYCYASDPLRNFLSRSNQIASYVEYIARLLVDVSKEKVVRACEPVLIGEKDLHAQWLKDEAQVVQLVEQIRARENVRAANGGVMPPAYQHHSRILHSTDLPATSQPINHNKLSIFQNEKVKPEEQITHNHQDADLIRP